MAFTTATCCWWIAACSPNPGQVVVAVLDGAFTLKRLECHGGRCVYRRPIPVIPLELDACSAVSDLGVATHVIHPL